MSRFEINMDGVRRAVEGAVDGWASQMTAVADRVFDSHANEPEEAVLAELEGRRVPRG